MNVFEVQNSMLNMGLRGTIKSDAEEEENGRIVLVVLSDWGGSTVY